MNGATIRTATSYVATTSHGADRWIVYIGIAGESRDQVRETAQRLICGENWNRAKTIQQDTELKQLTIHTYRQTPQHLIDLYYERDEREELRDELAEYERTHPQD